MLNYRVMVTFMATECCWGCQNDCHASSGDLRVCCPGALPGPDSLNNLHTSVAQFSRSPPHPVASLIVIFCMVGASLGCIKCLGSLCQSGASRLHAKYGRPVRATGGVVRYESSAPGSGRGIPSSPAQVFCLCHLNAPRNPTTRLAPEPPRTVRLADWGRKTHNSLRAAISPSPR